MLESNEALKRLFPDLHDKEADLLLTLAKAVEFPTGVTLCHDGVIEEEMYIITSGNVDVFTYQEGQRFYLNSLGAGECFGEIGLVLKRPRTGDVITASSLRALIIDQSVLAKLIETAPNIIIEIMRMLVSRILKQEERLMTELAAFRRRTLPAPSFFLSYSRHDEAFVLELYQKLHKHGLTIWLDLYALEPGKSWAQQIQSALDSCKAMFVVLSPHSVNSSNVEDEWHYYLDKRKPVIPLLYQQAEVPFRLNKLQYVNFINQDYDTAIARLLAVARQLLEQ